MGIKKEVTKSIIERVIDLSTFYTLLMGVRPKVLRIGRLEFREVLRLDSHLRTYNIWKLSAKDPVGRLDGLDVYRHTKDHHLEVV